MYILYSEIDIAIFLALGACDNSPGAQKVYLCKEGHMYGFHFLVWFTPLIVKKCCWQVWDVALYPKSLD